VDRLNATSPEYERWRDLSYVDGAKHTSEYMLMGFEDGIRNAVNTLKTDIPDVLSKIEKYVHRPASTAREVTDSSRCRRS
jgi:hypothetical protein